jgi:hypothetical protein
VIDSYLGALAAAPLAEQTRRTYASKVRQYLAWLAGAELDGDPLDSADGRDGAVRDYRTHLQAVLKRKPATVNSALAALDDFYIRRGLGAASATLRARMIERVRFHRFKQFADRTLELHPGVSLLGGGNNAGKSTILGSTTSLTWTTCSTCGVHDKAPKPLRGRD